MPTRLDAGVSAILRYLANCIPVAGLNFSPVETIVIAKPLTIARMYATRRRKTPVRLLVAAGEIGVIERLAREKKATDILIVGLDECPPGYVRWRNCRACAKGEWVSVYQAATSYMKPRAQEGHEEESSTEDDNG